MEAVIMRLDWVSVVISAALAMPMMEDSDTIFQIFKVIMKITNGITNIWIGSWVTNRPVANR